MESIRFEQSAKNIPIHDKQTYCQSINSMRTFDRNLRWRAKFYLNPSENPQKKEVYGFKSIANAPTVPELNNFRGDLIKLTQSVEFTPQSNKFLEKLRKEKFEIERQPKVFVPAFT